MPDVGGELEDGRGPQPAVEVVVQEDLGQRLHDVGPEMCHATNLPTARRRGRPAADRRAPAAAVRCDAGRVEPRGDRG
ncbi:hypothetical protein GCM10009751_07350 [Myceligenerans crystallogenes]|uniref:Uncharacterized protein n=1 Tax=Myceligenerans crystallogenes TaxID=316335 RepID=A0ABN2N7J9_9MICO